MSEANKKVNIRRPRSRSADRDADNGSKLVIIKIGTSSLMTQERMGGRLVSRMKLSSLGRLVETIIRLVGRGHRVVLVSSGAQGCGRIKLGLKDRPTTLPGKQAAAAAGQSYLMRLYEDLFDTASAEPKQRVAQLLINRRDFNHKHSFENIRNTINELLSMGVVPIINENDAVQPVTGQNHKFGDNDNLASLMAINMEADMLFLLTDVDFVYTSNPNEDPNAEPITDVVSLDDLEKKGVSTAIREGQKWGTGGMATKLTAARQACCAGIRTVLVNGAVPERMVPFVEHFENEDKASAGSGNVAAAIAAATAGNTESPLVGTYFHQLMSQSTIRDQRRWIMALPVNGRVYINSGCAKALFRKSSLLAAGVVRVEGDFVENDCVHILLVHEEPVSAEAAEPATASTGMKKVGSALVAEGDEEDVEELEDALEAKAKEQTGQAEEAPGADGTGAAKGPTLVAQALTNFTSSDLVRIRGLKSSEFEQALGYSPTDMEVCHRENIILMGKLS